MGVLQHIIKNLRKRTLNFEPVEQNKTKILDIRSNKQKAAVSIFKNC